MYDKIKEIQKKYGEAIFLMSIAHLFAIGIDNMAKVDNAELETACKKVVDETSDKAILSGTMQAQIMRCAWELSKFEIWEILKFIQTAKVISA